MGEYNRQNLVYEKEDLLISGPGNIRAIISSGSPGWRSAAKTRARPKTRTPPVDLREPLACEEDMPVMNVRLLRCRRRGRCRNRDGDHADRTPCTRCST